MRYAKARYEQYRRDVAYRIYVTDCLRIITENTAKIGGGSYISKRFYDLFYETKKDKRTAEEIVHDTLVGAGIEVI